MAITLDGWANRIMNDVIDLVFAAIDASAETYDPGVDKDWNRRARLINVRTKLQDNIRQGLERAVEEAVDEVKRRKA